ncbi:NAD(P)-binding protein [Atractiella rhizophila]|nr:NAD(P)-binding protein [Atractiella rhizophila]
MSTSAPSNSQPPCHVLSPSKIAEPFLQTIRTTIPPGTKPTLVGILASSDPAARQYADWTKKNCEDLGLGYELKVVEGGETSVGRVEEEILKANEDEAVAGIMVYYPIFGGTQDQYLQQTVSPLKDVEGLGHSYLFNLYHNIRSLSPFSLPSHSANPVHASASTSKQVKSILPCTPLAIIKALEHARVYNTLLPYGGRLYGRVITVINRSEVVGRPLAALLANDGARVFSVDIDSIQEFNRRGGADKEKNTFFPHHVAMPSNLSLDECLKLSDVVITGVPSDKYKVKTEQLKDGLVAINFSSAKGGNFEKDIKAKASIYLSSIGKVTITMLLRNLLRLTEYQAIVKEAQTEEQHP